ncbi:MAG: helix-turn-helix domain-containing protein [Christensenellaceae bacterium]
MTQAALAARVKCSQSMIVRWEKGSVSLRPVQFSRFYAFDCSCDYLLGKKRILARKASLIKRGRPRRNRKICGKGRKDEVTIRVSFGGIKVFSRKVFLRLDERPRYDIII